MFSAHGHSKTGIYGDLRHFTLLSFNAKIAKTLYFTGLCALNIVKRWSKKAPKTVPKERLSGPVVFWRIPWFLDDFFDPPQDHKKTPNPHPILDFYWKLTFLQIGNPRFKNIPKCRREGHFLRRFSKNTKEGRAAPEAPRVSGQGPRNAWTWPYPCRTASPSPKEKGAAAPRRRPTPTIWKAPRFTLFFGANIAPRWANIAPEMGQHSPRGGPT